MSYFSYKFNTDYGMFNFRSGNTKLGETINGVNIRPGFDCKNCQYCFQDCYARVSYAYYPEVKTNWNNNSQTLRAIDRANNWEVLTEPVNKFLKRKKPLYLRYLVSGDLLSQQNLFAYMQIALSNPKTNFLLFTKYYELDFSLVKFIKNLNVLISVFPLTPIEDFSHLVDRLPIAFINGDKRIKYFIGNNPEKYVCGGSCITCKKCYTEKGQPRIFNLH